MFNSITKLFKPFKAVVTLAEVANTYAEDYAQAVEDAKPVKEKQRIVNRQRDKMNVAIQMDDLRFENNEYQTKSEERFTKQRIAIAKRKLNNKFTVLDAEMHEMVIKGASMSLEALQTAVLKLQADREKLNAIKAMLDNPTEEILNDFGNESTDPFAGVDAL